MLNDKQMLGRSIKQAQYKLHRNMDTRLNRIGTTLVQWDALRAIENHPGASAHILAMATFQTDQAFGTLAKRLEAQKLIERRDGQGRRIEHHLTETGRETLSAGSKLADEFLDSVFNPFSEQERATLLGLLRRIIGEKAV